MESITIKEINPAELQALIEQSVRKVLAEPKTENDAAEPDAILTIEQAAEFLNLSKTTLYGYVHNSTIPVSKRGKRLYFSKQELLDWIKEGRRKTMSEIAQQATSRLQRNGL